jgi:hypothetical protein
MNSSHIQPCPFERFILEERERSFNRSSSRYIATCRLSAKVSCSLEGSEKQFFPTLRNESVNLSPEK